MLDKSIEKSERIKSLKRKNISQARKIAGLTSETKRLKTMITQNKRMKSTYEMVS